MQPLIYHDDMISSYVATCLYFYNATIGHHIDEPFTHLFRYMYLSTNYAHHNSIGIITVAAISVTSGVTESYSLHIPKIAFYSMGIQLFLFAHLDIIFNVMTDD